MKINTLISNFFERKKAKPKVDKKIKIRADRNKIEIRKIIEKIKEKRTLVLWKDQQNWQTFC